MPDLTLEVRPGSLDTTSMRYHELALQKWLYGRFFVRAGYPIPVVFATPMDAFAEFTKLWGDDQNPFLYLLKLKDADGTPLYEPHPSPIRYPLISVMRKGVKYRTYQNFSTHRFRHINWPTVSDAGGPIPGVPNQGTGLLKSDLGNITTSRMPMAFDYTFQIDHYCLRPDTQSFYLEKVLNQFWRTGGVLQSWLMVDYPGWGPQYVRVYVQGDIENVPPDDAELQNKNVEFRTSFTVTIEGFSVDVAYDIEPTLWTLILGPASPDQLDNLLLPAFTTDLRVYGTNLVLDSRTNVPPNGDFSVQASAEAQVQEGTAYISEGDPLVGTLAYNPLYGTVVGVTTLVDPRYAIIQATDTQVQSPQYSYGIASTLVFGTHTFTGTSI